MKIGFTGTRRGMTPIQKACFLEAIRTAGNEFEFHHGACVGADAEAERALPHGAYVVAHPGRPANGGHNEHLSRDALRASHEVRPEQTHFARNRAIVDETHILIATPWQSERPPKGTGGGTWYTIEYAEKKGKTVYVIWPDGVFLVLNPPTLAGVPWNPALSQAFRDSEPGWDESQAAGT